MLSDEILNAGYGIYSTICIIRDHNEWARKNMDKLQQTFLMTSPKVAESTAMTIDLMEDFFKDQFMINASKESMKYWQVYDRTNNEMLPSDQWSYHQEEQSITINQMKPWHKYTVSFMAYRIWEEISMYNHTTNNWNKEHLMQLDPRYQETQEFMLEWMDQWCKTHPDTTVVRFTSMFYNFVWIWGSNSRNQYLYSDWGSYDFTVSPLALDEFSKQYGYTLTAEDFINKGKLNVTHMPANQKKLDWMKFIHDFVIVFGKKLIDVVHKYGKQAYVFYDDSWIGIEPYSKRFKEFGFDGIIKCVFSGFEARLCAGVDVPVHELRLHPYLFPVGLGGAPTFMEGGNPTLDAKKFWNSIRRALLREPVERIGLGGYLHLVEPYPKFCDYIEKIADEFRTIKEFHKAGKPMTLKPKIAILTAWGSLRSWTLSGPVSYTHLRALDIGCFFLCRLSLVNKFFFTSPSL
ncbi:D-galactosyl-beta-1-4-L-rhamnose phosphorylase, partial [Lachnotalea glycerini]